MLNLMEKPKVKFDNEAYCNSPEWKELLELAANQVNLDYTIIYRDTDGDLKEAWHWISPMNLYDVQAKYKDKKKEIYFFGEKTLPFGAKLASMKGSSK
jgi:hypothetical protein